MPSSSDVLDALVRAGFALKQRDGGFYVVERGYRVVVVPDAPSLSPTQLETVLAAAGIAPAAFEKLLESVRVTRSGFFKKLED